MSFESTTAYCMPGCCHYKYSKLCTGHILSYFDRDINLNVHFHQTIIVQPSHVILSPILPYRMVVQHYTKPAIKAIRKWLSFYWELGPTQTFRTRWGLNGTVHRTGRWYIKHTVNPEAIFTTTLYHIKHLYNSFLHKIMYWLA